MRNIFNFVGKMSLSKESEKFHPYVEKEYPTSGWVRRDLKFNVVCGDNRHFCEIQGGCFKDGHQDVRTWSKSFTDTNGKRVQGKELNIPWAKRFDIDQINKVANFKKFIIDLGDTKKRHIIYDAIAHEKNGIITDEEYEKIGTKDLQAALNESLKARKEFLTEYDFTGFIYNLLKSGKMNNINVRIMGDIDIQPDDRAGHEGNFYRHYYPNHIYLATDTDVISEGQMDFYFNKDSFDDKSVTEKKCYYVNGFTKNYNSARKSNIFCPVMLTIPVGNSNDESDKTAKLASVLKNNFTVATTDSTWKELGVKLDLLEGAQKEHLTPEMLSENEKDMLDLGLTTMEDIVRDRGDKVYGKIVSEDIVKNFAKGFLKGAKQTVYKDDDFKVKPLTEMKEVKPSTGTDTKSAEDTMNEIFEGIDSE